MAQQAGLLQFVKVMRAKLSCSQQGVRIVYMSELVEKQNDQELNRYIADKIPLFYREPQKVIDSLGSGYFVTTMKETLAKLPTSKSFQESHFAEISCGIFAEEVMNLKILYSKLSLLTAENANAYKTDLVFYDPNTVPIQFVLGQVKSSMKTLQDGSPPGHDKSCYADLFRTLNHYTAADRDFDLGAAKDHIDNLPISEREHVRKALLPYSNTPIRYAGFVVIDSSTRDDAEVEVLAKRQNDKTFDIDLICMESLPKVTESAWKHLEKIRLSCS